MIYCLEDEESIRELLVYTLNHTGYQAKGFGSARELYKELRNELPQLLLLDIMLPEEDGITVLKNLKRDPKYKNIPVIMLTAKSSEYDKVTGLNSGADDYLCKPFGMMELTARIQAVLRRSAVEPEEALTYGPLTLDFATHRVLADTQEIPLTVKEFELLALLMRNPEKVMTRDVLLNTVWGYEFDGQTRTVDVHIRSLRKKLEPYDYIETVHGVGYRIGGIDEK